MGWSAGALLGAGAVGLPFIPVTTKQGVDYVVTTHRVPLYAKVVAFLDRDANCRSLVRAVTAGLRTDEARVLAVFDWTRRNIRDVPAGFPIVDDHVWSIVIRGYGSVDQKADVFTTLASYAGIRAYFVIASWGHGARAREAILSLALVDGRWRVFNVAKGVVFRNARGEMATPEEVGAAPGGPLEGATIPQPPAISRAEMQMPGPRLLFETKRLLLVDPGS